MLSANPNHAIVCRPPIAGRRRSRRARLARRRPVIDARGESATRDHRVRDQRRDLAGEEPNVPRKPTEIIDDTFRALDAGASLIHAHNSDFALRGEEAARDYLAAWRPILARRPARSGTRRCAVAPARPRCSRTSSRSCARCRCVLGGRSRIDQPRRAGRRRSSAGHRLREFLRRHPLRLRAVRAAAASPRASRSTSRACADRARLSPRGPPAARRDGQALLRRSLRRDGDAPGCTFGLPPTRHALLAYLDMLEGRACRGR